MIFVTSPNVCSFFRLTVFTSLFILKLIIPVYYETLEAHKRCYYNFLNVRDTHEFRQLTFAIIFNILV